MTARELEANGVATVIIGSGLDIVKECGVSRYLHNDIPLGNPLGHPYNSDEQLATVTKALEMIVRSERPTIELSQMKWQGGEDWRENYMRVDDSNREILRQAGIENRLARKTQIAKGEKR